MIISMNFEGRSSGPGVVPDNIAGADTITLEMTAGLSGAALALEVMWSYKLGDDEGQLRSSQFGNVRPKHFIVPILARRKPDRYEDQVRTDLASSVQASDRSLLAYIVQLASASYPQALKYQRDVRSVLGLPISHFIVDNGQQVGWSISDAEHIDLNRMGEGVSSALRLITEISTSKSKLFLIEEPETDLHPAALRRLLNLIIESSVEHQNQFIVSTHSDLVLRELGAVEGARIYRTKLKFDQDVPATSVKLVDDRSSRLELLSELGYDPELPSAWLVFEESTAERVCREVLIPFFAPDLRQLRTLAARGAGDIPRRVTDLHRVVLFAHLSEVYRDRVWVIADGDQAGDEAISKLRLFTTWDHSRFTQWPRPCFEDLYPPRFADKVAEIRATKDWRKQEQLKGELAATVCKWSIQEPEAAKAELEESAGDAIATLRSIGAAFVAAVRREAGAT
jgi:hypothetical protein